MRLPRLLDAQMREVARLEPVRLSATVNMGPISTATMVLPPDGAVPGIRQWVEIYRGDESLGVYRVSAVRTLYGRQQEVSLEHGLTTLEDCTTPEETELTGSFHSILSTLLSYQTDARWVLGDVDVPASESHTFQTSGDLCLQAVISLMETVKGYRLAFDQSTQPWTLHVKRLETEPSCECRMSRNINSVSVALDESDMVTRAISAMLPGGYRDGPTIGQWGVISRPIDIDEEATEAEAIRQADEYLDTYKDPAISIEIDALELAALTGESMDSFGVGRLCRTALPDYGVTVNECIRSVYYEDLLHAPDRIKLTLATTARTTQKSLAGLSRSQSKTSRVVRRNTVKIIENENELLVQAQKILAQAEEIALQAQQINVQAGEIAVKADAVLLDAYVKIADLETKVLNVLSYATVANLVADNIVATAGSFSEVSAQSVHAVGSFSVGNASVSMQEQKVITAVGGRSVTGEYKTIQYLNWDGQKASTSVCTGITQSAFSNTEKTLRFLGQPAE